MRAASYFIGSSFDTRSGGADRTRASGARLPSFASADRHTAEVDYINAAVVERWGLVTTVLRSLRHGDPDPAGGSVARAHELEVHSRDPGPPPGTRWDGPEIVASLPAEDAAIAAEWFAAEPLPPHAVDGCGWTRPGWLAGARGWIEQRVRDGGAGALREIVQLRSLGVIVRVARARQRRRPVLQGGARDWTRVGGDRVPGALLPRGGAAPARRRR